MTVTTTAAKAGPYSGNGITTEFSTIFQFRDSDELVVIQTDDEGNESTLTLGSDYTVSGGAGETGTVTVTTAVPSGETLLIIRETDDTQQTDFDSVGSFSAVIHEVAFDKLSMRLQELEEIISRAPKFAQTASASQIASTPIPIDTASKFLKIGSTGLLELSTATDGSVTIDRSTLGELFYPQTLAESNANVTPTDYGYEPYTAERYGYLIAASAAANAIALQEAINSAAQAGHGVVTINSRGKASVDASEVYFYYDATNNPNFPSSANQQGNITIRGQGFADFNAYDNSIYQGSMIDVGSDTLTIGDGSLNLRAVRFENCSVVGNSSNYVVKFDKVSRGVGFNNFSVIQDGAGGGVEMDDCFAVNCGYSWIYTSNGSNTGTGFYVHNSSQAAGEYSFNTVNVRDFNKNWVLGEEGTSASSMSNISLVACQGIGGAYNLIMGNGAKAAVISTFHNEGPTTLGVLFGWGCSNIDFRGAFHSAAGASADYMSIGQNTGTAGEEFTRNVRIINNQFTGITNTAIEYYSSTSSLNNQISHNTFAHGSGTTVGIDVEDAASHGLIVGPNFYSGLGTNINNPNRIDINYDGDTAGLITFRSPVSTGNRVNVASATDITYVTTGNVWRITGSTTINTISAPDEDVSATNPEITLYFNGNVTVNDDSTSSGNLVLSGGSDFSATANDVLKLVWDDNGSKWLEVTRSVN